ncbi:MAG: N-acetylmuramoyl-L-alanine amidase [Roseiflexus sp.]|nr:N-acetylmuramoyl-L-alanine amidase [Roseiflexus sp.]
MNVSLREPFRSLLEPVALEEGASVFVSIHINAAEGGEGIEVWYNHFGKELAKAILDSNTVFPRRKNPLVERNELTVVGNFPGSAVVVEVGFINKRRDV